MIMNRLVSPTWISAGIAEPSFPCGLTDEI